MDSELLMVAHACATLAPPLPRSRSWDGHRSIVHHWVFPAIFGRRAKVSSLTSLDTSLFFEGEFLIFVAAAAMAIIVVTVPFATVNGAVAGAFVAAVGFEAAFEVNHFGHAIEALLSTSGRWRSGWPQRPRWLYDRPIQQWPGCFSVG